MEEIEVTYLSGKEATNVAKLMDKYFDKVSKAVLATGAKSTEGVVLNKATTEAWGIPDGE